MLKVFSSSNVSATQNSQNAELINDQAASMHNNKETFHICTNTRNVPIFTRSIQLCKHNDIIDVSGSHTSFPCATQSHRVSGLRPVWHGQQGGVAEPQLTTGGGHKDPQVVGQGGGQGQVPAGRSHHGPVQTPQRGQTPRHRQGTTDCEFNHQKSIHNSPFFYPP